MSLPNIQFGPDTDNSPIYITAVDNVVYKLNTIKNNITNSFSGGNISFDFICFDSKDSNNYVILSGGTFIGFKNTDSYPIVVSTEILDTDSGNYIQSLSMFDGYINLSTSDGGYWFSTKKYWETIGIYHWKQMNSAANIKSLSPIVNNNDQLAIANNYELWYYNYNRNTNPTPPAKGVTKLLESGCKYAVMNESLDIWYIDNNNNLMFIWHEWYPNNNNGNVKNSSDAQVKQPNPSIKYPLPPGINGVLSVYYMNGKLGIISTDGDVFLAIGNINYENINNTTISWVRYGLTSIHKSVNNQKDRILNNIVSFTQSQNYIINNTYANLTIPDSNPNYDSYPDSIIKSTLKSGSSIYPFKVLSLYDLVMIGKAQLVMRGDYQSPPQTYSSIYLLTFYEDDNYLPLGDVIINEKTDISTVFCILIAKSSTYCSIIPNTSVTQVIDSTDRGNGDGGTRGMLIYTPFSLQKNPVNNTFLRNTAGGSSSYCSFDKYGNYFSSTTNSNRILWGVNSGSKTNDRKDSTQTNYVVGDVCVVYNSNSDIKVGGTGSYWGDYIDGSNNYLNFVYSNDSTKNSSTRVFASVNGNYLSKLDNTSNSKNIFDFSKIGTLYKNYVTNGTNGSMWSSSPFNTCIYQGQGITNNLYIDFIPEYVVAALCGNNTTYNNLNLNSKPNPVISDCQQFMINYMSANNFSHINDGTANDWCKSTPVPYPNCDSTLMTYCALDSNGNTRTKNTASVSLGTPDGQINGIYPKYSQSICNCFMPSDYYKARAYNEYIGAYGQDSGDKLYNMINTAGGFNRPECNNKNCSQTQSVWSNQFRTASQSCPSVQVCFNELNINEKNANIENSPANITQSNNCTQNSNSSPASSPPGPAPASSPPAPTPAPPASSPPASSPPAPTPAPPSNILNQKLLIICTIIALLLLFIFL